jgi:aspartate kinase
VGLKPRVLKFGGTSVGSLEPLRAAVGIVAAAARERPVVVVVSALDGVTNALEAALAGAAARRLDARGFARALRERHLALLRAVTGGPAGARGAVARATALVRERAAELQGRLESVARAGLADAPTRAAVFAAGERLSAPVFAAAVDSLGAQRAARVALALDAAALVRTDEVWSAAAVDFPATRERVRTTLGELPVTTIPVVTGFIGGTADGRTTLLGRGGSDYTAALFGWALEAERVEIWTDVPGVMSADPRRDTSARTLPRLGYREAAELARRGAKVLHPRTLEPLEPLGIPVLVGRTLEPDGPSTWIGPTEGQVFQPQVLTYGDVGTKWNCARQSYIEDDPTTPSQPVNLDEATREALVMGLFRRGKVSIGKACELLSLDRSAFIRRANGHNVPVSVSAGSITPDAARAL